MRKYAFCLQTLADIRIPRVCGGVATSGLLQEMRRVLQGVFIFENAMDRPLFVPLTRRSVSPVLCDDKGGVCPDDYFSKRMQKNSRFDNFYPLIIVARPDRNSENHAGKQNRHYFELKRRKRSTTKVSNGVRGTQ